MREIAKIYESIPEKSHYFQVAFVDGGFSGFIVKPWSERTRSIFKIEPELNAKLQGLTGVSHPVGLPEPLPSPGMFNIEFVLMGVQDVPELVGFAQEIMKQAMPTGKFRFLDPVGRKA